MVYNPSYSVAVEQDNVVVRFKRDVIDEAALAQFLHYLELQSVRKSSQLSQDQAAALADEIDRSFWDTIKDTFGK